MFEEVYTVSQLTGEIKFTLENAFPHVKVLGEISNFKAHGSGHWYFTLKDADAAISCTMWRSYNAGVFFTPQDGMKIVVEGAINVYPPRGSYQINVRKMSPAGEGELQAAFERLKRKLKAEGLFDEKFKKPIPKFPQVIGIVTAEGAAALRDMISVAARRYPLVKLVHAPASVQGEGAAEEIAKAIERLNALEEIDVIIVGRGGGSLEDLWAFNEEIVARAIFASQKPIISGVGHEVDFTIADFVADLRAPTPTAAMELATPNADEIFGFLDEFLYNSKLSLKGFIESKRAEISGILNSYGFRKVKDRTMNYYQTIDNLLLDNERLVKRRIERLKHKIELAKRTVAAADVSRSLKKGFSIVRQEGKILTAADEADENKELNITFYDKNLDIAEWRRKK